MGNDSLLILLIHSGAPRVLPYLTAYWQAVRAFASRAVVVIPEGFTGIEALEGPDHPLRVVTLPQDTPVTLAAVRPLLADWLTDCEHLILTDDSQLGPWCDLHPIFDRMESRQADLWSMLRIAARPGVPAHLDPAFLVCGPKVLAQPEVWDKLEDAAFLDPEALACAGLQAAFYADTCRYDFPLGENDCDYTVYYPWELIQQHGYPFLKMAACRENTHLDYTHQESLPKAMHWIEGKNPALADAIWATLGELLEPGALKEQLQLYHIVDARQSAAQPAPAGRAAVFLHLFYGDLLPETLQYADAVPPEMDLYITTHGTDQIETVRQHFAATGRTNVRVLEAGQRGRDAGALLVAMRPYLLQYDYLCFVHDKKTSGGRGPRMLGDTFRNLVFENLLASPQYIHNVLALFEAHPRLGFLSPPCPVTLGYQAFSGGFGNEWTHCYDVTLKLAQHLNLRHLPRREDRLFTVSNTFWCRTAALRKLFETEWSVEDFPPEPLGDDGTLNHAVERIYEFVVRDAGYYSALLLEKDFASSYLCNLDASLASLLQLCRDGITLRDSEDIRAVLRQLFASYPSLLAQSNLLQEENEKKDAYIAQLTRQLSEATLRRDLLKDDNDRKEQYIQELTQQLSEATTRRDLLEAENGRKEQYIQELTQKLGAATMRRDLLETKCTRQQIYIAELKSGSHSKDRRIADLKDRLDQS